MFGRNDSVHISHPQTVASFGSGRTAFGSDRFENEGRRVSVCLCAG